MIIKLALVFFGLAVFGLVHQQIVSNSWFSWEQFWHHEPLIVCCVIAGLVALVCKYIKG